jgi:hypothetical protein
VGCRRPEPETSENLLDHHGLLGKAMIRIGPARLGQMRGSTSYRSFYFLEDTSLLTMGERGEGQLGKSLREIADPTEQEPHQQATLSATFQ